MAISDLQIEKFGVWKWIYWSWSYPVYWKMFQPYDWNDIIPSSWIWDDVYTMDETTSFDVSWFQQWNEVYAWIILISNQSTSSVSAQFYLYFDQKKNWSWYNPWTSNYDLWYATIRWKDWDNTWWQCWGYWWWVDTDEIRSW